MRPSPGEGPWLTCDHMTHVYVYELVPHRFTHLVVKHTTIY